MAEFSLQFTESPSDSDLIADIRRVAADTKCTTLSIRLYTDKGRYHPRTVSRRFGSWNRAITLAGLETTDTTPISLDELFVNLEFVWRRLGRQPSLREMKPPISQYSGDVYKRRFKSWRAALEAFVKFINESDSEQPPLTEYPQPPEKRRDPSLRLRFQVMKRDDFRCCTCGRSPATHRGVELVIDHKQPWSRQGLTTLDNLQTLCAECNQGKSDDPG